MIELPKVTLDGFLGFNPCWANTSEGMRRLRYYAKKLGGSANAVDILRLNRVSADDRLWAVLREEFIPAEILHEFACRCTERALSMVKNPDPRSIAAIDAKRKWLRCEITDDELKAAWAAARATVWAATMPAAWAAESDAARAAVWAAESDAARAAVWDDERKWQINELLRMLTE